MVEDEVMLSKIESIKKQISDYKKQPISRRLPQIRELLEQFDSVLDFCKKSIQEKKVKTE
jgi:hypothetical protein